MYILLFFIGVIACFIFAPIGILIIAAAIILDLHTTAAKKRSQVEFERHLKYTDQDAYSKYMRDKDSNSRSWLSKFFIGG